MNLDKMDLNKYKHKRHQLNTKIEIIKEIENQQKEFPKKTIYSIAVELSEKYNIHKSNILYWKKVYDKKGIEAFKSNEERKYSVKVLFSEKEYKEIHKKYFTTTKYGNSASEIIRNVLLLYNNNDDD